MGCLEAVAMKTKIKDGLIRAAAIYGKTMVLLFEMREGVHIELHRHPHAQMGYVFRGCFDFVTDKQRYENGPLDSYIIKERALHKVIATADFYSMDIKYMGAACQVEEIVYDVLREVRKTEEYELFEVALDRNKVYKVVPRRKNAHIILPVLADNVYCVAVSDCCTIGIAGVTHALEPMEIYEYTAAEAIDLRVYTEDADLFIFEVAR